MFIFFCPLCMHASSSKVYFMQHFNDHSPAIWEFYVINSSGSFRFKVARDSKIFNLVWFPYWLSLCAVELSLSHCTAFIFVHAWLFSMTIRTMAVNLSRWVAQFSLKDEILHLFISNSCLWGICSPVTISSSNVLFAFKRIYRWYSHDCLWKCHEF